jgi:hypothetical protein
VEGKPQQTTVRAGQQPETVDERALHEFAPSSAQSSRPMKEIAIRVGVPEQSQVDVRLKDADGDVHVFVTAGDRDLARALREDLAGLAAKFDEAGFRFDAAPAGDADHSGGYDGEKDSADGGGRQQRQHQRRSDAEWLDETGDKAEKEESWQPVP